MVISLAVEASAGCWLGCPWGTPANCLLCRPPSLGHSRARLLSCLLLIWLMLWLMLLMREQALVQDVLSAYRSPSLLWRLACELAPSPHLPLPPGHRDLADAALRWLAANSQEFPSSQDNVGPLYGAGLRHVPSFAAASALRLRMAAMVDLRPSSCCSTSECLGVLVSPCTNLLYSIFFIFF